MTIFLPLEASTPFPPAPHFLVQSQDPNAQLQKAIKAILKAKRIVVVCGAGISVQAGIPDFRSPEGLFQTLKKDNPKEALSSGKDLFDAAVFNFEHTTSLFYQMIAQLSELSKRAEPTSFHNLLRTLDDRGRLLRVYTQNIDAIESKCGLSFGVPEFVESKRGKGRSSVKSKVGSVVTPPSGEEGNDANGTLSSAANTIPLDGQNLAESSSMSQESQPDSQSVPSSSQQQLAPPSRPPHHRLPSPPVETPRCIPLHGTLQAMHCQVCTHSFPLEDYMPNLAAGQPPTCPKCLSNEESRQQNGKRSRGIGKLRPSVVLYNEEHRDGEGVGEVVRKDLMGLNRERLDRATASGSGSVNGASSGNWGGTGTGNGSSGSGRVKVRGGAADLLLVVGTSLKVPGTKRIVREFSKAVRLKGSGSAASDGQNGEDEGATAGGSHGTQAGAGGNVNVKSIYLNLDFPMPMREWEGVFDGWIQGDAQKFAEMVQEEIEKENRAKELAEERKRRKGEEAAAAAAAQAMTHEGAQDVAMGEPQTGAGLSGEEGQSGDAVCLAPAPKGTKRKSTGSGPGNKRRKVTPDDSSNLLNRLGGLNRRRSLSPPSPPGTPPEEEREGRARTKSRGLSRKPKSMSSITFSAPSTIMNAPGAAGCGRKKSVPGLASMSNTNSTMKAATATGRKKPLSASASSISGGGSSGFIIKLPPRVEVVIGHHPSIGGNRTRGRTTSRNDLQTHGGCSGGEDKHTADMDAGVEAITRGFNSLGGTISSSPSLSSLSSLSDASLYLPTQPVGSLFNMTLPTSPDREADLSGSTALQSSPEATFHPPDGTLPRLALLSPSKFFFSPRLQALAPEHDSSQSLAPAAPLETFQLPGHSRQQKKGVVKKARKPRTKAERREARLRSKRTSTGVARARSNTLTGCLTPPEPASPPEASTTAPIQVPTPVSEDAPVVLPLSLESDSTSDPSSESAQVVTRQRQKLQEKEKERLRYRGESYLKPRPGRSLNRPLFRNFVGVRQGVRPDGDMVVEEAMRDNEVLREREETGNRTHAPQAQAIVSMS
ncbi:hypothetical protein AX16_010125 [Volvariella volvacea WC 439]|nr:hypothetical protein AX16_010125 [Volvariella volvacea WC 439]